MIITDEAKTMLEEVLASNESNCLKAMMQKSCCGTSLVFNLAKLEADDKPTSVNGIAVLMDDEIKKRAESVTIIVENGALDIRDEAKTNC